MRWFKKSSDPPIPRLLSLSPLRHSDQEVLCDNDGEESSNANSRMRSTSADNGDVKGMSSSRKSRKGM
jgi:hypothetical protein